VLQMANIDVLKEYAETGESIHAIFTITRIEDRSTLQKPFEQINPEEVTTIIYEWLSKYRGRVAKIQLRVQNADRSVMHYIGT